MISIDEAISLVLKHAGRQPMAPTPLAEALGLVLAEDVCADVDSPPFDKAMMDGFALRSDDVKSGVPGSGLKIVGSVRAGETPSQTVGPGEAMGITTGSPIPNGADAVVMIERCRVSGDVVVVDDHDLSPGKNILPRASEYRKGQTLFGAGHRLGPAEIGVLAAVGIVQPRVFRRVRLGIITTGDEIVDPSLVPGPGQIRNSNGGTLQALANAVGTIVTVYPKVPDHLDALTTAIRTGLADDILLLTGGVSAGGFDFVPKALSAAGVRQVFHKVAWKPGAPLWFGEHESGIVFGLPGNPVSVLACFEMFVATAIRTRLGIVDARPQYVIARLDADFSYPTKRETYHPAELVFSESGASVLPLPWQGSADVFGAASANALVVLPVGSGQHAAGTKLRVLPLTRPDGSIKWVGEI